MLELVFELLPDVVAFGAIIGLFLMWLWEQADRTQPAGSSQEGRSSDSDSGRQEPLHLPLRKAG